MTIKLDKITLFNKYATADNANHSTLSIPSLNFIGKLFGIIEIIANLKIINLIYAQVVVNIIQHKYLPSFL